MVPSSTSARNSDSSASKEASIAATQTTPGAMRRNSSMAGLMASGNSMVTMAKKISG
jgi:hypothetical protein